MRLVLTIAAALLTLPSLAQTSATARFRAAETKWLAHRQDGLTFHDDSPAAVEAMSKMRNIGIEVATKTLSKNPSTTATQLQKLLAALPKDTELNDSKVLQLKPGLFAVAFDDYPSSIFFIVRTRPASTPLVWSIDRPGPQPIDTRHRLNAWLAARSGDRCQDLRIRDVRDTCGPVKASVGLLPPDTKGNPRFYLSASYSKDAGILTGVQTSIWRWNDDHAELLWLTYYTGDPGEEATDIGVAFRNGLLLMDQKDGFDTFYANNSDSARHLRHSVRITPSTVEDLGLRSLDPELDLVDTFFDHVARNLPVAGLASSEIVQQLCPKILQTKKLNEKTADLGMIQDWSVDRHQGHTTLCLNVEKLGGYRFTLSPGANGKMQITGLSGNGDPTMSCQGTEPLSRPN